MMAQLLSNITAFNRSNATDMIIEGKVIEVAFGSYYILIGMWFFTFLFIFTYIMVYIASKNMATTSIVMLFLSAALAMYMPPELLGFAFLFVAITLAVLIVSLFLGRGT